MNLHSKYTDYKIIYKDKEYEKIEHINDSNRTIEIKYYESGQIKQERWMLNGECHREDGPAYINYYESGQIQDKSWHLNGEWHRKDGPAIIYYYKSGRIKQEKWVFNNKYHREDGPAKIFYINSGNIIKQHFYLNDIEYTYKDFIQTPEYQAYLKQKSANIFD